MTRFFAEQSSSLTRSSVLDQTAGKSDPADAAKNEFLATMSHELRTPLHAIIGYANLLLDNQELHPKQQFCVDRILTAGRTLLGIVDDILHVSDLDLAPSKVENGVFSLHSLAEGTMAIVRPVAAAKDLKCVLSLAGDLPGELKGDEKLLGQVLLNLLNNAVKFTPSGEISLTINAVSGGANGRRTFRFDIRDTGIGIAPEMWDYIFGRFTQVDSAMSRRFGGAGLGLAICQGLVQLMGGRLAVESALGQGSHFSVFIDLDVVDPTGPEDRSLGKVAAKIGSRILLVDDIELNQDFAKAVLERDGHVVEVAANGVDAVRAVRENDYDLVLMDIQMPIMDGITATQHIRKLGAPKCAVPIVAMTSNVLPHSVETCHSAGMDDFIGKPFTLAGLSDAIDRWSLASAHGATQKRAFQM